MKTCPNCHHEMNDMHWQCSNCTWSGQQNGTYISLLTDENQLEITGYRDEFFAPLAAIEAEHFWFQARNRIIVWALKTYFPHIQNFLEIGCGTGFVLSGIHRAFPDLHLSGAEYYPSGLSFAQSRVPDATFYQLDARAMPFEHEFDVIGAFDVIEHIKEDELVLSEVFKALKPGGGVLLTVPQHKFLWSVADEYKHHERRYARQELVDKLRSAGFEVVHATSFVTFLLPVMYLSRLTQNTYKQQSDNVPDRMTELDISPLANSLLKPVMRVEIAAIQRQVRLPMGGSLLIVARKPA